MRSSVILRIVGAFLQIFAFLLAIPIIVGVYYDETLYEFSGFIVASLSSLTLGYLVYVSGKVEGSLSPNVPEAMFATVLGWMLAIAFGAIPFLTHLGIMDALFESAAGLTTTGISMVLEPETLSSSVLFWRSFMQWIGGLGILTFFVAVIRESGGATRRLYSAESHKTDSGSIRPSLTKSIADLWKVYIFITAVFTAVYVLLGMPTFDSLLHSFSGISTGGFSTISESIAGFNSVHIELATILLMFLGGMNFVLIYRFLKTDYKSMFQSAEFRLYCKVFLVMAALTAFELVRKGINADRAVLDGVFTSAAILSSTGYSTITVTSLSVALQTAFIGVMLVGGSLGSTSGGFKIFRLKAMIELLKTHLRSYKLPKSAINEVKIDGEILDNTMIKTISVLFFSWIALVFLGSLAVLYADQTTFMEALSGTVSAAGNMGPVYMEGYEMTELSVYTKFTWIIVMIAGRLELLPLLAIFNSELFKDSK